MPLVPDAAVFRESLRGLPVMSCPAGATVLTAGSADGRLLVLRSGAVEVVKDGVRIAEVSSPGSVFGELAALLDRSHTADVRTLEPSEFDVANATLLAGNSMVTLHVAAILARRLDSANRAVIELKRQLQAGESRRVIGKTVEKVQELLSSGGEASLVYAGYPYDPFAEDRRSVARLGA
ncbi:MAG TPA: cyclic nucleotide-binding domain-containing protein [Stellaceae bacterium]|nr:cyclic nucleotide-binding domain-containing protein [Stellaceae bacterium]